jgi:dTDP-4-dehydrorhamnose 3,5-epimerase
MNLLETGFENLYLVEFFRMLDDRGCFIKPWVRGLSESTFSSVDECYFSTSKAGTLRGLHFQSGEKSQKKFVVCLSGSIEDVAVDLRPGSATYQQVFRKRLDGFSNQGVLIPEGFAHGIFAWTDATIVNFCDKPYSPGDEGGVYWGSVPTLADLPVIVLSEKDKGLPALSDI